MFKIAVAGPPSSGKTSVIHATKLLLKNLGLSCIIIPEFSRHYIECIGRPPLKSQDQHSISTMMHKLERAYCDTFEDYIDVLLCDAVVFNCIAYTKRYWPNDKGLLKETIQHAKQHSYDLILFTEPLPLQQDNVRYQTQEDNTFLKEELWRLTKEYHTGDVLVLRPNHATRITDISRYLRDKVMPKVREKNKQV